MIQNNDFEQNFAWNLQRKVNKVVEIETISKNETKRKIKVICKVPIILTAVLFFFCQITIAQINLEHTFDATVGASYQFISPVINYYTYFNIETSQVRLYNEDYSLYKTINISSPSNYKMAYVSGFSKGIVSTDGKITFLVSFGKITSDGNYNSNYIGKLYDQDGNMIKDFGYSGTLLSPSFHVVSNNVCRMSISILEYEPYPTAKYKTEIYSLPGTLSVGVSSPQKNQIQSPYPNPANSVITLPYQLGEGETSVMRIYNVNGQLIETKQIDFVFDRILLNVSSYTKGVYIYQVNEISNRFIVE